jgi:hypothetical protein
MMTSSQLREHLGLSRASWSRALGVHERTVARWEEEGVDPGGLAAEVMRGIGIALDEGADPQRIGRLVVQGVSEVVFNGLRSHLHHRPRLVRR